MPRPPAAPAGAAEGGHSHGASVASGMRRRPIDVHRKLPLVRSSKELVLEDDTAVAQDVVRMATFSPALGRGFPVAFPPAASTLTSLPDRRVSHPAAVLPIRTFHLAPATLWGEPDPVI